MPRTLIVANTLAQARDYARQHDYSNVDVTGGDLNYLRGRHAERVIIVGEISEETKKVLAPTLVEAEVLYAA